MTIYSLDMLLSPILNQPFVPCPVLTVGSCPAHRFLRRQVRCSAVANSLRIFQFVLIHTVKCFSIVSEAEVDVFLKLPCFFCNPSDVGSLISGSSAFSKPSLYIWKFLIDVLMKPSLKDFEHNLASMLNECNCMVIWTFFGVIFLWDWNETWPFPILWSLLSFPNLLAYWVQHFHRSVF